MPHRIKSPYRAKKNNKFALINLVIAKRRRERSYRNERFQRFVQNRIIKIVDAIESKTIERILDEINL